MSGTGREVRVVFDPAVAEEDRSLIEELSLRRLPRSLAAAADDADPEAEPPLPDWAPRVARREVAGKGFTSAVLGGVTYGFYELAMICFDSDIGLLIPVGVVVCGVGVVPGAIGLGSLGKVIGGLRPGTPEARRQLAAWRTAVRNRDGYVSPRELSKLHKRLLVRAQQAADRVIASRSHSDGIIDSTRNEVELPSQLWRIAVDLRDLDRHIWRLHEVRKDVTSEEGIAVLAQRQQRVDQARAAVGTRVERIVTYADRVEELDARLDEVRALELIGSADSTGQVLARIDANADDAEYLAGMEAQALAALKVGLEAAQEAALMVE
jgi:hypothetical protein